MKRFLSTVLVALLLAFSLPAPAGATDVFTLKASNAQTGSGQGTGTDIGNWRALFVVVTVSAGSGTVNPFRVWIEATPDDGTTWYPVGCSQVLKASAAAPGTTALQRDIVSEVAVVTSETYSALCDVRVNKVRVAWTMSGSTPSETFAVRAVGK